MTIRSYLRVVVFVAAAAAGHGALAQGSRVVTIDPGSEDGLVRLSYIDDAAKYNFEKMFEIPMLLDQEPLALVLRNTSGQAIVAVTIRWTATTAGRSGVYDSSTDSLGMQAGGATSTSLPLPGQARPAGIPAQLGRSWSSANGPVVIANGERMLVAPGMFAKEDMNKQRMSPDGYSSIPAALRNADTISVTLDAVVLESGQVLGPDASHTVDDLRARKAAIDGLFGAVTAAEQNGQDGLEVLRKLADWRPTGPSDPQTLQQSRLAHALMASRQWRERLAKLAAIQLPNFHR